MITEFVDVTRAAIVYRLKCEINGTEYTGRYYNIEHDW